jgi:pimeloyl-ACP methyl ester carboxylesterase
MAVETFRSIGSPGYPVDEARIRDVAIRSFDRGHDPGGYLRQLTAVLAQPDRTSKLRRIGVPTLVIHGSKDKMVAKSGGVATARSIPGARLMIVDGMGHDLPEAAWPQLVEAIAGHAHAADRAASGTSLSAS